MTIKFTYREEPNNCYRDFLMEFVEIGKTQIADTYFFADVARDKEGIIDCLKRHINDGKEMVMNMSEEYYCIIPFDLSDQYVGALKVSFTNGEYFAQYILIDDKAGWNWSDDFMKVHPLNYLPNFKTDVEIEFNMTREEILNSFQLHVIHIN